MYGLTTRIVIYRDLSEGDKVRYGLTAKNRERRTPF
jgi:hypothetical protein